MRWTGTGCTLAALQRSPCGPEVAASRVAAPGNGPTRSPSRAVPCRAVPCMAVLLDRKRTERDPSESVERRTRADCRACTEIRHARGTDAWPLQGAHGARRAPTDRLCKLGRTAALDFKRRHVHLLIVVACAHVMDAPYQMHRMHEPARNGMRCTPSHDRCLRCTRRRGSIPKTHRATQNGGYVLGGACPA